MFCTLCSGFFTPGGNSMAPSACQGWQSNFSKSIFTPSRIFVCWANQQTKQSKQNVQYLSQYRGSIVLVLFFAHSSLSAGSCHSAPVTGNPRQSEAMSPQQLATCRQWPGPTVASLLGALSCSHRSDLGLKFLLYLQSHIWCLQWMSAVASSALVLHNVGGDTGPMVTTHQWSLDTAVPVPPPLTIIHTRGADQKHWPRRYSSSLIFIQRLLIKKICPWIILTHTHTRVFRSGAELFYALIIYCVHYTLTLNKFIYDGCCINGSLHS